MIVWKALTRGEACGLYWEDNTQPGDMGLGQHAGSMKQKNKQPPPLDIFTRCRSKDANTLQGGTRSHRTTSRFRYKKQGQLEPFGAALSSASKAGTHIKHRGNRFYLSSSGSSFRSRNSPSPEDLPRSVVAEILGDVASFVSGEVSHSENGNNGGWW